MLYGYAVSPAFAKLRRSIMETDSIQSANIVKSLENNKLAFRKLQHSLNQHGGECLRNFSYFLNVFHPTTGSTNETRQAASQKMVTGTKS